jgi:hypothetical protein
LSGNQIDARFAAINPSHASCTACLIWTMSGRLNSAMSGSSLVDAAFPATIPRGDVRSAAGKAGVSGLWRIKGFLLPQMRFTPRVFYAAC